MRTLDIKNNSDWKAFQDYIAGNNFASFIFIGQEDFRSEFSLTAGGAWKTKVGQVGALEVVKHNILHHEGE